VLNATYEPLCVVPVRRAVVLVLKEKAEVLQQYCGAAAENIDHVIPRSRGGEHVWENVVASCRPCNAAKEDRLLSETHLTLRRPPFAPKETIWIVVAVGTVDPAWAPYLGPALEALPA
jgi:5-methylcytosine-specific restriction endonuclease McrA